MESLIILIARQTELEFLNMPFNLLTEEQEQRIRSAVASPNCRIILTKEESE